MKMFSLCLLLLLFLSNCQTGESDNENASAEVTLIGKGNLYGGYAQGIDELRLVINSETEWNALIDLLDTVNNVSDTFSETEIDFSEYTVIAVVGEIKSNGGHELALDLTVNLHQIIVTVTDIFPQGNATTVITQPYHIIKIPKTTVPIVFE